MYIYRFFYEKTQMVENEHMRFENGKLGKRLHDRMNSGRQKCQIIFKF